MFTRTALNNYVHEFLRAMADAGYLPERAILFGSYANGKPRPESDIDIAIWHKEFTGCVSIDCVPLLPILSRFPQIEIHTFERGDTVSSNPFIKEIEKNGIELAITQQHAA